MSNSLLARIFSRKDKIGEVFNFSLSLSLLVRIFSRRVFNFSLSLCSRSKERRMDGSRGRGRDTYRVEGTAGVASPGDNGMASEEASEERRTAL